MDIRVDDLIVADGSRGSDHGCKDYAVLRILGISPVDPGDLDVVAKEVEHCHSCWQVGHDADHRFLEIRAVGDVVPIRADRVFPIRDEGSFGGCQWEYV